MPVVLGGDFNLYPTSNVLDQIYGNGGGGASGLFKEAGGCTWRATVTKKCNAATRIEGRSIHKLDYVFLSGKDFWGAGITTGPSATSDHDYVYAKFGACPKRDC
jgi:endonuclease/exonuclease/phosphatase (EEP) superfamily protein YafD